MTLQWAYGCGHAIHPNKVKVPYWECPECGNGRVPGDMQECPVCGGPHSGKIYILKGCRICRGDKEEEYQRIIDKYEVID